MDLAAYEGFVPLEECADRLDLSVAEVLDLVRHRVLRAVDYGMGLLYVEPAIVTGAIPNEA